MFLFCRGQTSSKSAAFRSQYNMIGSIRSIIPDAAAIAMTATATKEVTQKVITSLGLTTPAIIRASPERKNIRKVKL